MNLKLSAKHFKKGSQPNLCIEMISVHKIIWDCSAVVQCENKSRLKFYYYDHGMLTKCVI